MHEINMQHNSLFLGARCDWRIKIDTFQSSGSRWDQTWNQRIKVSTLHYKDGYGYMNWNRWWLYIRQLRHENVIRFIGVCTHPQHLCIITELCAKGDLFDVIRNYKKPNFSQLVIHYQAEKCIITAITKTFVILGDVHVWYCPWCLVSPYKKVS